MGNTICYEINNKIYINMTNRCSNNCDFCVRNHSDGVEGYYLWLDKEPSVDEIINNLKDVEKYKEAVFCGFGEPMYRFKDILIVAKYIKDKGVPTRINTNGQASLIIGDGIAEKLKGLIDTINISLNATDATKYQEICKSKYGEMAFYSMLDFARQCVKFIPNVVLSVVDVIGEEEIKKAQKIADDIGAKLRVRTFIP